MVSIFMVFFCYSYIVKFRNIGLMTNLKSSYTILWDGVSTGPKQAYVSFNVKSSRLGKNIKQQFDATVLLPTREKKEHN